MQNLNSRNRGDQRLLCPFSSIVEKPEGGKDEEEKRTTGRTDGTVIENRDERMRERAAQATKKIK
jgi:hypothetical protein